MSRSDPIGAILVREGYLAQAKLDELLATPAEGLPLASRCLKLGLVTPRQVTWALSRHQGVPGVLLEQCVIHLRLLQAVPERFASRSLLLPFRMESQHLLVAVANPRDREVLNEVKLLTGLIPVPHVAAHWSLKHTIGQCYEALRAGEIYYRGPDVSPSATITRQGLMVVICDVDEIPDVGEDSRAPSPPEEPWGEGEGYGLVVEPDGERRHELATMLESQGLEAVAAADGRTALAIIERSLPRVLLSNAFLPGLNGYELCQRLREGGHQVRVILYADRVDSSSDLFKSRYGADVFLKSPFGEKTLVGALEGREDQPEPQVDEREAAFQRAIELYEQGHVDEAIALAEEEVRSNPQSVRHQFLLANLYQHKGQIYEAISAYETTIALRPNFFLALSRLAFLYYQKGFMHKAVEAWHRALGCVPDQRTKEGIESFLRKLVKRIQEEGDP